MADRVANIFVLVEDREQQNLVRRYLELCGQNVKRVRFEPLPAGAGSGEQYVREHYAAQVRAFRYCRGRRASALLIVMVDADMISVEARAAQLAAQLETNGLDPRADDEPIAILIPKRHVETWIRALLGEQVDEQKSYKRPKPTGSEIRQASEALFISTRPHSEPGDTAPASLIVAIPEWRKVG